MQHAALAVEALTHRFGERLALDAVTFDVRPGEIFGLLGPNGGGKTTLFRIASTLLRASSGRVRIFGADAAAQAAAARARMGVVFQKPALDARLTVAENLRHQGHLYGLAGDTLKRRSDAVLEAVGLTDRAGDFVAVLSGGLQRRVEVAKALLHQPDLLLLDEPSTGLDPSARRDIWEDLCRLRERRGTTVVLTTHLMEEASACDRVAILDCGRLVASGTPAALVSSIGGDVLLVTARDAASLAPRIGARFETPAEVVDGRIRIERDQGHRFIAALVEAFPGEIDAVALGKPTLEDVFVHFTGRRFD
ncbi:MAG: ABC transporter ATP-binding protein [Acidobacteria bacterium]|nr:MAG: ABC transporter ATP-binding protein [Acidobacteriota bacterium]RPJ73846.1 MAG: ABC transporter ATP-binding protein [Acidobacteriota bacterium]